MRTKVRTLFSAAMIYLVCLTASSSAGESSRKTREASLAAAAGEGKRSKRLGSADYLVSAADSLDWPFISDQELCMIERGMAQLDRYLIYLDVIAQADAGNKSYLTEFKNRLSPRFRVEFITFHIKREQEFREFVAKQRTYGDRPSAPLAKPRMSMLDGLALLAEVMNKLKPSEDLAPEEQVQILSLQLVSLGVIGDFVEARNPQVLREYAATLSPADRLELQKLLITIASVAREYSDEHPGISSEDVLYELFVGKSRRDQ